MSENVEPIRSVYEDMENPFGLLDDDVASYEMEGFPYGGVCHGPAEIQQNVFREPMDDWEEFSATPDTFLADGDRVVTLGRYAGVARRGGKRMDAAFAHVYRLRNGQIVEFRQFADSARVGDALA